jgi:hypothetical protein
MIYLTTLILTLILTHIARALPEESPTLDDTQFTFLIPSPLRTTSDNTFDNPRGSLNDVACSDGEHGLAKIYPNFINLPNFPNIGGAFDVEFNSPNCGGCWKITNNANGASIFVTAIDTAPDGFNIAEAAFRKLNGGELGDTLEVVAQKATFGGCLGGHE